MMSLTPLAIIVAFAVPQLNPKPVPVRHRVGLYLASPVLAGVETTTVGRTLGGGGASGLTISTTTITGGTDTRVLFDDAGTVGEDAGFVYNKATDSVTLLGNITAITGVFSTSVELSHATANSLTAASGVLSIEGVALVDVSSAQSISGKTIPSFELGAAVTDTTIARSAAGTMTIEGVTVAELGTVQSWTAAQTFTAPVLIPPGSVAAPGLVFTGTGDNEGIALTGGGGGLTFVLDAVAYQTIGATNTTLKSTSGLGWSSGDPSAAGADTILLRDAAAAIQLGADAASPVNQTLGAHDAVGTDIAGPSFSSNGGRSTGTGLGGAVVHQTSPSGSTGASLNSLAVRDYIYAGVKTLTAAAATDVVRVALAQRGFAGGLFQYCVRASDATDDLLRCGEAEFSAVNKAGTETCTIATIGTDVCSDTVTPGTCAVSTLTAALTCTSASADTVDIEINAAAAITETTLNVGWRLQMNYGSGTVTPQ